MAFYYRKNGYNMDKPISSIEKSLISEFARRDPQPCPGPDGLALAGQRCGIWIFMTGVQACARGGVDLRTTRPRVFGYYSLAHVYGGGGVHWRPESGLQKVEAGDVVFSLPGQAHIYGPRADEEWREDWLAFTGPRAEMLRSSGMLESGVLKGVLSTRRVRDIGRLAREQTYEGLVRAAALLELLLTDLHLGSQQRKAAGALEKIQTLAGEIETLPERSWTLPEMAAEAQLSESHLRRLFQQAYEMSPHEYVEHSRLRKGAALLRDTTLAVGEIAEQAGYADPFHFSSRFRKNYGISPSGYRKICMTATKMH